MFDVAFSELVVIGILALVVLGPKRLPEVARTAGQWMGRVRNFVENAKRDMQAEMRKDELAELRQVKDQLFETKQVLEQSMTDPVGPALAAIPEPSASATTPAVTPASPAPAVARRKKSARAKSVKKKTAARRGRKAHG